MTEGFGGCVHVCWGCMDELRIMKRQKDSPSLGRREGRTECGGGRENASQKTDGERKREVKEINRENEGWVEGRKKGREEGERGNEDDTVCTW